MSCTRSSSCPLHPFLPRLAAPPPPPPAKSASRLSFRSAASGSDSESTTGTTATGRQSVLFVTHIACQLGNGVACAVPCAQFGRLLECSLRQFLKAPPASLPGKQICLSALSQLLHICLGALRSANYNNDKCKARRQMLCRTKNIVSAATRALQTLHHELLQLMSRLPYQCPGKRWSRLS